VSKSHQYAVPVLGSIVLSGTVYLMYAC